MPIRSFRSPVSGPSTTSRSLVSEFILTRTARANLAIAIAWSALGSGSPATATYRAKTIDVSHVSKDNQKSLEQIIDTYIAISYGLNLVDCTFFGNLVKGTVDIFQENEDLRRLSHRRPSSKATDVSKHHSCFEKEIRHRLGQKSCIGGATFAEKGLQITVFLVCLVLLLLINKTFSHVLWEKRCHNCVGLGRLGHKVLISLLNKNIVEIEDKGDNDEGDRDNCCKNLWCV